MGRRLHLHQRIGTEADQLVYHSKSREVRLLGDHLPSKGRRNYNTVEDVVVADLRSALTGDVYLFHIPIASTPPVYVFDRRLHMY